MTELPARLNAVLETALLSVKDEGQREELRLVAGVIAYATWQHWLAWRPREDNRPEHEWVVFANIMKIAEAERLTLSERRIATAFAFTHDTFFIPRITEAMTREADGESKKQLEADKKQQRVDHMKGGAANARFILAQLKDPRRAGAALLTDEEIARCADIVAGHDRWKSDEPPPRGTDRLAVVCLEGDALWPLHPIGVLADLERPDKVRDACDPAAWQKELKESLKTLRQYRANWTGLNERFIDEESIFRTEEGHRLYREWRQFWSLEETAEPGAAADRSGTG
jgi:hypothetical protein